MPADRALLFGFVFGLRFGLRLPLHIARLIQTAMLQRLNVIDNVTRARARFAACGRTRIRALEGSLGRRRSRDATAAVSRTA